MRATYIKYVLNFKRPSGTSRGVLTQKDTYFLLLNEGGKLGVGECGLLRTLSVDDRVDYEEKLAWVCEHIHLGEERLWADLEAFPSIQFGVEQAFRSLRAEAWYNLFPSDFTSGKAQIPINGLVWMGQPEFMKAQIREKLAQGFRCIKMKIGAIDFSEEYALLQGIRLEFSPEDIELRVDANGAFAPEQAMDYLNRLADLQLHSIEQPIKAGQWEAMARLCERTPLPIALDEELIGVFSKEEKQRLLEAIRPQYIILKPSLIGGYKGSEQWITLAEGLNIGWWVTSALESNIGLNAIAQWTYTLGSPLPQGLGTGSLYTNNIPFPLEVKDGKLGLRL
ncbi:o-succinylbenzoate synthase [Capnocytophaga haemolytica]